MILKVYLKNLLIGLFYAIEFLIDNFILVDKPFAKTLQSFETFVLFRNNLCRKLFSSLESPTTFDESSKAASALFFILHFNLLSC